MPHPNVDAFSSAGDPIQLSDSRRSAAAAKAAFLKSATRAIVVVDDLRGLELFLSATRLLLEGSLLSVHAISEMDLDNLLRNSAPDDREAVKEALLKSRLVILNTDSVQELSLP